MPHHLVPERRHCNCNDHSLQFSWRQPCLNILATEENRVPQTKLVMMVVAGLTGQSLAGELQKLHLQLHADVKVEASQSRTMEEIQSTEHGITEIGIERTPCFGKCEVYSAVIRSDGTFHFFGQANVRHMGRHTGRVSEEDFHELARFINDTGYARLEHAYELPVTDMPTVFTMVARTDRRKVIRNYGNAGPMKLWSVEQLIDKLLLEARWDTPTGRQR
jgi:hypothetical protein